MEPRSFDTRLDEGFLLDLKQLPQNTSTTTFKKFYKQYSRAITLVDLNDIYRLNPYFFHWLIQKGPGAIQRIKKKLPHYIKNSPKFVFMLLNDLHEALPDASINLFCDRCVTQFDINFVTKNLTKFQVPVLKKLLKTNLGTLILTLFPIRSDDPRGASLAKCPDAVSAIKGPGDLETLEKQNPSMALALFHYHPSLVKLKLILAGPSDFGMDILIKSIIKFDLFKKDPAFFERLADTNWHMAEKLLQHELIVKQLENHWKKIKTLPFQHLLKQCGFDQPEKKTSSLKKVEHLDLATDAIIKNPPSKAVDEYDMANIKKIIAKDFFTTKSYFFEMMYGKTGYYTTGKIAFHKDTKEKIERSDFSTTASDLKTRIAFASTLAHQLFQFRNNMIDKKKLAPTDLFNVLECGAGDGDLCTAIFDVIVKMAEKDTAWAEFYKCFRYHILEKSPELSKRQQENTKTYADKITYAQGDAMQLSKTYPAKSMAAIISNELLDMFPPDKVTLNKNGIAYNIMMVPTISKNHFIKYFYNFYEEKEKGLGFKRLNDLLNKTKAHKGHLNWALGPKVLNSDYYKNEDTVLLDKSDFLELHAIYSADQRFAPLQYNEIKIFDFLNAYLEVSYFPKLQKFIHHSPDLLSSLKIGEEKLICTGVEDFAKGAATILQDEGFVLTVDYGGTINDISKNLRTYDGQVGYDISSTPGFIDMTYDVDFLSYCRTATNYGLELSQYSLQADLATDEIKAQFSKAAIVDEKDFHHFMKKSPSTFKVCIQQKSKTPFKNPANLPISHREEFINQRKQFALFIKPEGTAALVKKELNRISGSEWKIFENGQFALTEITDVTAQEALHYLFVKQSIFVQTATDSGKIKIKIPSLEVLIRLPSVTSSLQLAR